MNQPSSSQSFQQSTWSPDFIGIGAEKAATTWLWANLNAHPEIEMSQPKELNFFNLQYEKGIDWYRHHFRQTEGCLQGEISPWYMDHEQCAERIQKCCPDVKLMVMLRDPLERAFSHLLHDCQNAFGGIADLTVEQMQSMACQTDDYVRRSCYSQCLEPFFDRFDGHRIHVEFYDNVKSSAADTIRRAYQFLNVCDDFLPEACDQPVNKSQNYRSVVLHRMASTVSQTAQSFPVTRDIMDWIHRRTTWRERAIELLMVDQGRPQVSATDVFSRQQLRTISEDARRLGGILGTSLPTHWTGAETEVAHAA